MTKVISVSLSSSLKLDTTRVGEFMLLSASDPHGVPTQPLSRQTGVVKLALAQLHRAENQQLATEGVA